jgi:divalent metal cation (Fe/Co/Zn/Cd) transporter
MTTTPFGHRRAENPGALGEAAILAGGGIFIVTAATGQLASGHHALGARALVGAVVASAGGDQRVAGAAARDAATARSASSMLSRALMATAAATPEPAAVGTRARGSVLLPAA